MKKLMLISFILVTSLITNANASIIASKDFVSNESATFSKHLANANKIDYKEGFLTSKECVEKGLFRDCNLDSYSRSDMVLYVHDENKIYTMAMNNDLKIATYENAININSVKFFGKVDSNKNIITVAGLSVPPAPKKTKFKGCM